MPGPAPRPLRRWHSSRRAEKNPCPSSPLTLDPPGPALRSKSVGTTRQRRTCKRGLQGPHDQGAVWPAIRHKRLDGFQEEKVQPRADAQSDDGRLRASPQPLPTGLRRGVGRRAVAAGHLPRAHALAARAPGMRSARGTRRHDPPSPPPPPHGHTPRLHAGGKTQAHSPHGSRLAASGRTPGAGPCSRPPACASARRPMAAQWR